MLSVQSIQKHSKVNELDKMPKWPITNSTVDTIKHKLTVLLASDFLFLPDGLYIILMEGWNRAESLARPNIALCTSVTPLFKVALNDSLVVRSRLRVTLRRHRHRGAMCGILIGESGVLVARASPFSTIRSSMLMGKSSTEWRLIGRHINEDSSVRSDLVRGHKSYSARMLGITLTWHLLIIWNAQSNTN